MLNGKYELSIWKDTWYNPPNGAPAHFREEKIAIIATDSMLSQNRAHQIKLLRKTNGEVQLSFKLYSKYVDMISGEEVDNPFIGLLSTETKLKLKKDDKWYDLIINKVDQDSSKKVFSYTAIDQHILELSKNGFNLVLDQTLFNNSGSLPELAQTILKDTDWEVDIDNSNVCYQTVEESLVKLKVSPSIKDSINGSKQIIDPDENTTYKSINESIISNDKELKLLPGASIYAFYSSCKGKPNLFQFIYVQPSNQELIDHLRSLNSNDGIDAKTYAKILELLPECRNEFQFNEGTYKLVNPDKGYEDIEDRIEALDYIVNKDGIITNPNSQYVLDVISTNTQYGEINNDGFYIPEWCDPVVHRVSNNLRGNRYVFSQKGMYNEMLKSYLYECKDLTKSSYISASFIPNLQGGVASFQSGHYLKYIDSNVFEYNFLYNGKLGQCENKIIVEGLQETEKKLLCAFSQQHLDLSHSGYLIDGYSLQEFIHHPFKGRNFEYRKTATLNEPETVEVNGKQYYRIDFRSSIDKAPDIIKDGEEELKLTNPILFSIDNDKITGLTFNNDYINQDSAPIGKLSANLVAAVWVTTDDGYVYKDGKICDKNNNEFIVYNTKTVDKTTYYLIYKTFSYYQGLPIAAVSLSIQKAEKGFNLIFDNFEELRTLYENDPIHVYSYLLVEKETNLNFSNILAEYKVEYDTYSSSGQEPNSNCRNLKLTFVSDLRAPYLTPLKIKDNEIFIKAKVQYAPSYMLEKTEYMSPKFLTNLCGNSDFNTVTGWTAGVFAADLNHTNTVYDDVKYSPSNYRGSVEAGGAKEIYENFVNAGLQNTEYVFPTEGNKYLKYSSPSYCVNYDARRIYPVLISSGPYSQRSTIGSLKKGTSYIALIKYRTEEHQPMKIQVAAHPYSTLKGCYYQNNSLSNVFLEYPSDEAQWEALKDDGKIKFKDEAIRNKYQGYYYMISTVKEHNFSDEDFQRMKVQVFCTYNWINNQTSNEVQHVDIEDLQIIPYITDLEGNIITPKSDLDHFEPKTSYQYYSADNLLNATNKNQLTSLYEQFDTPAYDKYPAVYYTNAEKTRSISIKESNYFNALSTLSEQFQSWLRFDVEHDEIGRITHKKILFKNYAGEQSWSGFRYGANLNSIKRTVDSKNIVTKMIVKNNSNVAAKNGFCSIARSTLNELGENFILDFDYYVQQKLISKEELQAILYDLESDTQQPDRINLLHLEDKTEGELQTLLNQINSYTNWNCYGYIKRISALNLNSTPFLEKMNDVYIPLNQAISDLAVAEAGVAAANDAIQEENNAFYALMKCDITDTGFTTSLDKDNDGVLNSSEVAQLKNNRDAQSIAYRWIENRIKLAEFENKKSIAQAQKEEYESQYKKFSLIVDIFNACKSHINLAFFQMLGRFIKEGTWIEEKYSDDNEYYIDAKATMYNSCFPQVSYSISVQNQDWNEEYKYYKVELGDKSYVEDPEFFGYNEDGTPYQEEIVVSEITETLDNPLEKNIKVQNYKTQFQDLFQRITATVQQTKYAEGSYHRAADVITGGPNDKSSLVEDALKDPDLVIQTGAQQSVTESRDGLIVTDTITGARLKLVGGAIYFSNSDVSAGEWKAAISANGIAANVITTGQLNTNRVTLFNDGTPTFRWDSLGLTAYDYLTDASGNVTSYNFGKGVRFDHLGVYGYDVGQSNEKSYIFQPHEEGILTSEQLIEHDAIKFAISWDGFKMLSFSNKNSANEWNAGYTYIGSIQHSNYEDTEQQFMIDVGKRSYKDGTNTYEPVFTVTKDGSAAFYGDFGVYITDDDGEKSPIFEVLQENKQVLIGGYIVKSDALVSDDSSTMSLRMRAKSMVPNVLLSPKGLNYLIGTLDSKQSHNWVLKAGDNFGVTAEGHLYASQAFLTDKGQISMWTIHKDGLFNTSNDLNFVLTKRQDVAYIDEEIFKGAVSDIKPMSNVSLQNIALGIGNKDYEQTQKDKCQGFYTLFTEVKPIFSAQGWVYDVNKPPEERWSLGTIYSDNSHSSSIFQTGKISIPPNFTEDITLTMIVRVKDWNTNGVYVTQNLNNAQAISYCEHAGGMSSNLLTTTLYTKFTGLDSQITITQDELNSVEEKIIKKYTFYSYTYEFGTRKENFTIDFTIRCSNRSISLTIQSQGVIAVDSGKDFMSYPPDEWDNLSQEQKDFMKARTVWSTFNTLFGCYLNLPSNEDVLNPNKYKFKVTHEGDVYAQQMYANNFSSAQTTLAEGAVTSSDRSLKNNICSLYDLKYLKYELLYDSLIPSAYTLIRGTENRIHFGLIAQDVKQNMELNGITFKEFAPYCEWKNSSDELTCGIRYEELVPMNIWQIQKLKKRVSQLEEQLANLTSSQNSDIIYIEEKEQENDNNAT